MSNISVIIDGATGSAQGREGTTVQTLALSIASGAVLFGIQFTAFAINRNYLWAKRIYQPRSFLVPLKDRVKPPANNLIRWARGVYSITSSTEVLHKAGMDAYFFLRYLTMCLKIFVPAALLILPILLPVNAVHGKNLQTLNGVPYNVTGLDVLAWSNITPAHTSRYWAHLVLAVCLIAWTFFIFHYEMEHYVFRRLEYLGSPSHRLKASSTTVLITDISADLCTNESLTNMYDDFPGGVRRIWINRDLSKLVEKDDQRRQFSDLLENAETDLIRKAIKRSKKTSNATNASTESSEGETINLASPSRTITKGETQLGETTQADCEKDLQYDLDTKAKWTRYIKPKHRKTMRIPKPNHKGAFKIPLIGRFFSQRVDVIYYCRREIARLNIEIEQDMEGTDSLPPNGSAFIQFNTQKAAHLACQAVADTKPRSMIQRTVEISPADINWPALHKDWLNRFIRLFSFVVLFAALIVGFGLISFFTGILSKISTLADSTSWLRWIASLPRWLLSFLQGTLPPVILVIVLSGPTPILLRAMTNKLRGAITGSQGERSLQYWYFILLLLELFIIPTISSGLTSVVQELVQNTAAVTSILAKNLPTAANYYFSFLVVQALSISASSICQTVRLFNFYVLGNANTPDSLFAKLTFTHLTRIGSNIPWYTTFAVVGLVYAVIAPLMLIFVSFTFGLFWFIIKNNVLYVVRTGTIDSGGLWFPHAINQTFTGIYFMEICLIGLFFLVRDENDNVACEAQGTIMAVCLGLTILYQIWLTTNFAGLIKYAPLRLENMAVQQDREYEALRLTPRTITEKFPEKVSQMREHDGSHSQPDQEPPLPTVDFGAENRRISSRASGPMDRSKEMQAQKEEDQKQGRGVLARLNRPLDEIRLRTLETQLATVEERIGNVLLPRAKDIEARMMNDPISKIIMQHNDELEDLTAEERDMLISIAFTNPVLREPIPCTWFPQDDLGISDDEVIRTKALSQHLHVENRGAFFDKKLRVGVDMPPPDLSEFAFVMAEL